MEFSDTTGLQDALRDEMQECALSPHECGSILPTLPRC